jgi:hypothetical protein
MAADYQPESMSFCSELARSHDVSPVGTATEAAHWLLIEDPSPWGAEAVEDADWFSDVQRTLGRWQEAVPDLRIQLIRRALGTRDTAGQIRCVAVRAGPDSAMHRWTLDTYRGLVALDVPAALRSSDAEEDFAPLLLTCVNGQRDACCAKWGRPVAEAATAADPEGTWQTSHLGGHRFAPTALVLPHGTHYGWLRPDDVPDLIEAHRDGQLYDLDRVRGHVHQPRPVQAACLTLRRRLGMTDLGAVQGEALTEEGDGSWTVKVVADGQGHTARVHREERAVAFPHSCGSDETKADVAWRVTWAETDASLHQ